MTLPLAGIRVVEWSLYATGPMSCLMLRDLGADVIRIEEPTRGDPTRHMAFVAGIADTRAPGGRNAFYEAMNFGKRCITPNLKHPQGREIALRLIDKADVFVQNYRPSVVQKLGLDYQTIRARNPTIVYAGASAFGERGPRAHFSGNDFTGQARSGLMWGASDPDMPPYYHLAGFPDMTGATLLAHAVLNGLLARARYGTGQKIELSNLGAAMWIQYQAVAMNLLLGGNWPSRDRRRPGNALENVYRCADGEWIVIAGDLEQDWERFCGRVGLEGLLTDARFTAVSDRRRRDEALVQILDQQFAAKPAADWLAALRAEPALPAEQLQRVHDLQHDAQALANGYIREIDHSVIGRTKVRAHPVRFSGFEPKERTPAPELGEHNFDVLTNELGYSSDEIAELISSGAIG